LEKFSEEMTILANNEKMQAAQNVKIALLSKLDDWDGVTGPVDKDLRQVVVQKTSIIDGYTYVLQHVAGDNFVYRGKNGNNVSFNKQIPVLHLTGTLQVILRRWRQLEDQGSGSLAQSQTT